MLAEKTVAARNPDEEKTPKSEYILEVTDLKKHFLIRKEWKLRKVAAEEPKDAKEEPEESEQPAAEESAEGEHKPEQKKKLKLSLE